MALQKRVAIVTGSTSGIGLGIAKTLAGAGADLLLNGFGDAGEIDRTRLEIGRTHNVRVGYSAADMTQPGQIAAMIAQAELEFGRVDILVNNAGVQHVAPIEHFPAEQWDRIIATNLSAVFHATKSVIPPMRRNGWGRIVNIASAHGLVASGEKSAYVAAKHGVIGLTKVAAIELAEAAITVNAICPGWVRTPLVEAQLTSRASREGRPVDEVTRDFLSEKQPMVQFTAPEQIGAFVLFLCSDEAATVTGAALSIDGGWTAR